MEELATSHATTQFGGYAQLPEKLQIAYGVVRISSFTTSQLRTQRRAAVNMAVICVALPLLHYLAPENSSLFNYLLVGCIGLAISVGAWLAARPGTEFLVSARGVGRKLPKRAEEWFLWHEIREVVFSGSIPFVDVKVITDAHPNGVFVGRSYLDPVRGMQGELTTLILANLPSDIPVSIVGPAPSRLPRYGLFGLTISQFAVAALLVGACLWVLGILQNGETDTARYAGLIGLFGALAALMVVTGLVTFFTARSPKNRADYERFPKFKRGPRTLEQALLERLMIPMVSELRFAYQSRPVPTVNSKRKNPAAWIWLTCGFGFSLILAFGANGSPSAEVIVSISILICVGVGLVMLVSGARPITPLEPAPQSLDDVIILRGTKTFVQRDGVEHEVSTMTWPTRQIDAAANAFVASSSAFTWDDEKVTYVVSELIEVGQDELG